MLRTLVNAAVAGACLAAMIAPLLAQDTLPVSGRAAQSRTPDLRVELAPARPAQGTLFRIRVSSGVKSDVIGVGGTLGGEPLHFRPDDDGVREAIAAIPLGVGDSLLVALVALRWSGTVDTIPVHIPVAPGAYRLGRLTVAPQFGTPPDSATAARIASETARAMAVSDGAHSTALLWDSVVRPRDTRVTSGFGHGREFNGVVQSRHTGTDLAGDSGSPVRAAARGVVALVDAFFLAGNVIYLDHGGGLVSAYFHLSSQEVAQGDTVAAGQVIGRVGATGRVTGPHLHWVVRYGRISVDPLSLLALMEDRDG